METQDRTQPTTIISDGLFIECMVLLSLKNSNNRRKKVMTRKLNILINYVVIIIIFFSYIIIRNYDDFRYVQLVQKSFLSILFLCGLTLVYSNYLYIKQVSKKIVPIIFLSVGLGVSVYSGILLYLVMALQNMGF